MPLRPAIGAVVALLGVVLAGCGQSAAPLLPPQRPLVRHVKADAGKTPDYVQPNPSGQPVSGSAGRACLKALGAKGIATSRLTENSFAVPPQPITLSSSLTSGPFVQGEGVASGIETATWNLLSRASGLPLTPYLGKTLLEVQLTNPGSTRIGGYTCFEQGTAVVGMFAEQPYYSLQPMGAVAIDGRTVRELTGLDYLHWLEKVKAYLPHPVPDTPNLSAAAALLDSFDVLNANLPVAERKGLEASLAPGGPNSGPLGAQYQVMQAYVPIAISPWRPPAGFPAQNATLQREYSVELWPHFRHFAPKYLAGDGWVGFFYSLARKTIQDPWRVVSSGTGP